MTGRGRLGTTGALLALALPLGACGGDDEKSGTSAEPRDLAVSVTGPAKGAKFEFPKTAKAGVTRLELKNDAKGPHSIQLARYDGDRSPDEAVKAGNQWAGNGKPLPDWLHLEGGVPTVKAGATGFSIQNLPPGKYAALDLEAQDNKAVASFEVTGKAPEGEGLPAPKARINASEYTFRAAGLTAGKTEILFDNQGSEPHFVEAAPLKPGKTVEDVKKALKSRKGPPPIDEKATTGTPVLDGKGRQVVELELKKGKYALICFVPDRKGGPPHAVKGMIAAAEVK